MKSRALLLTVALAPIVFLMIGNNASSQPTDEIGSEKKMDFLKEGIKIDDASSNLTSEKRKKYTIALKRFPTLDACVQDSAVDADLEKVNVSGVENEEDLEVCIFWLTSHWLDATKLRRILERSGFDLHPNILYPASAMRRFGFSEGGTLINATMSSERIPKRLLSVLEYLIPPHSLSLGILVSSDGHPINVSVSKTRL